MNIASNQGFKRTLLAVVILLAMTTTSLAAKIKDVNFSETVTVGQKELKLQGVAVLKWARLFDVYAGAFYLPEGIPGLAWTEDLPKHLELSYFRKIKGSDFADTSISLLQRNLPEQEYQVIAERLQRFCSFFRDVMPGDRYSLSYSPGTGTELRLNDRPLGSVPGTDFAVAYFGIWLGQNPINDDFRDRLLSGR